MYEKTYKSKVLGQNDAPIKKNKKFSFWKKLLFVVIFLGLLFGIGSLLRFSKMQIDTFNIVGTTVLDVEDIQESVRGQLVGTWLWIFPRTSVLLINDKAIERSLKEQFSRIETVTVKRTNLHTIEITIKEFDAVYLWCTSIDEDCYFMDKQGIVYSKAPVFSGTAYPKVFTGSPLQALPFVGMSSSELARVAELQEKLSEINITPVAFINVSTRYLQIDFLHNKTIAKLQIDPTTPTSTSLEYLFSGIRTEPLASLFRDESKKLLYIDVRFPNKVVYKFDQPTKVEE